MKIYLHGKIGKKFGKEWDLNVTSPNEALRAIDANTGNFFKYLASKQDENIFFKVYINKKLVRNHEELGIDSEKIENVHFLPFIKGANEMGQECLKWGGIGLGVSFGLDYLGSSIGGKVGSFIGAIADIGYEISLSLIMQGAISFLQKEPPTPPTEAAAPDAKNTSSFTFSRPLNNTTQGAPVPLGYGRLRVGSHVISSSTMNTRLVAFNQVRDSTIDQNGDLVGAINIDHYTT